MSIGVYADVELEVTLNCAMREAYAVRLGCAGPLGHNSRVLLWVYLDLVTLYKTPEPPRRSSAVGPGLGPLIWYSNGSGRDHQHHVSGATLTVANIWHCEYRQRYRVSKARIDLTERFVEEKSLKAARF